MMASPDITVRAHCHCNHFSHTYNFPASAFPLKVDHCHCNSCRYATGQLSASFIGTQTSQPDVSHLTAYATSKKVTRYFCPKCGASVANQHDDGEWVIASGMLETMQSLPGRIHGWIEDTKDGGMSAWLLEDRGEMYLRGGGSPKIADTESQQMVKPRSAKSASETLAASCHCGGIQLCITRPTAEPEGDRVQGKYWLASDGHRYNAVLDTCHSCRLVSGFEVSAWVYVPRCNIFMADGSPLDLSAGTFEHYESSPGTFRDFCKGCGATVFFRRDGRDPQVLDIACGLFRSDTGARADDWLDWVGLDFPEDTDRNFVDRLTAGIKSRRSATS